MSEVSYQIHGTDLQYVEVTLPPQASFIGEQGAMMYMDDNIEVTTVLGDGSASSFGVIGRFFKAVKRSFTGEAMFSSRYKNTGKTPKRVAFATPMISKILAMDLDELGGELICQRGAYLAGEDGIEVSLAWQKRLRVGLFGGEGFIMQRINGNGIVFVNATGALTEMILSPGQTLRLDSGCLVALSPSVAYEIKYAGKLKTAFFGGEGLFYTTLTGPGKVWLQSLPVRRLSKEMFKNAYFRANSGFSAKLYLLAVIIFAIGSVLVEMDKKGLL